MGSTDGNLLIGATPENTFSVWDIETGERLARFTEHSALVIALLFSPYGEFLTSVDWDGGLRKWETGKLTTNESRSIITSMPEATKLVQYTYSADGVLLASTASGTTITVWDVERNRKIANLVHKEAVQKVRFSQEGSQLVVITGENTIQVWDVAKSEPQSPAIRGHTSVCGAVKFSPDSTLLASDSFDRTILLWDIKPYLSSIDTTSELSQ